IIMWQLVARRNPFDHCEHNIGLLRNIFEGLRPQIITGIPADYERMMKRCWNANPLHRPDAQELYNYFNKMLERINDEENLLPDLEFNPSFSQTNSFNNHKSVNLDFRNELNSDDVNKHK
ncbi:10192_t:CDS:2, partial [Scutellospora calospora]